MQFSYHWKLNALAIREHYTMKYFTIIQKTQTEAHDIFFMIKDFCFVDTPVCVCGGRERGPPL